MVRQWRHLKLLKHGGHGHDPSGALGTAPGALALVCPVCPHPDINLPPDWKLIEPARRYVKIYDSAPGE